MHCINKWRFILHMQLNNPKNFTKIVHRLPPMVIFIFTNINHAIYVILMGKYSLCIKQNAFTPAHDVSVCLDTATFKSICVHRKSSMIYSMLFLINLKWKYTFYYPSILGVSVYNDADLHSYKILHISLIQENIMKMIFFM